MDPQFTVNVFLVGDVTNKTVMHSAGFNVSHENKEPEIKEKENCKLVQCVNLLQFRGFSLFHVKLFKKTEKYYILKACLRHTQTFIINLEYFYIKPH